MTDERTHIDLRLSRELKKRLQKMADNERRSTNAQIEWLLDQSVRSYQLTGKMEEPIAA